MPNLSSKEKMLLEDQKKHEQQCVQKYSNYANQAQDPQLQQVFSKLGNQEQQHLDTINQILSGQTPNINQQGAQGSMESQSSQSSQSSTGSQDIQSSSSQSSQMSQSQDYQMEFSSENMAQMIQQSGGSSQGQSGMQNVDDASLCNDMLMTEKFVSGAYDTAIFEFADSNIRQALNHIQKEEQQHGEQIFNYMQNNGMYNQQ